MKQRFPALAAALCGLALAACGGDDPRVTVPEAPAGVYLVATGSEDALYSGHYYVGEDGSATLAIEGTAGAGLMRLFKHAAGGRWPGSPAGVFRATLSTSQCPGVPARLSGVLISHPDAVAQAFRLLLDADGSVYDWWAYTD